MERDRLLASASSAQLAIGLAGVMVARKRQLAYDLPLLHGRPEKVSRDALWIGTALSAPSPMLVAQGWATVRLLRGAKGPERFVLGGLGVTMTVGYLGETLVRWRLRPSNWDPLESTVASCGVALAVAMAVVACRSLGKPD